MKLRLQLLLVVTLLLSSAACGEKIEPGSAKVHHPLVTGIRLATAQTLSRPAFYEAVGTVQAGISSDLAAELMGTVESIAVGEGDLVKAGDILITLDRRQVNANLHRAQAGLAEAQQAWTAAISARDAANAAAELAQTTYNRYLTLKQEESVSSQEFDEVRARYQQAQAAYEQAEALVSVAAARVRQAKANLKAAQVTLRYTLISAPHGGIITAKLVDVGDLATPGGSLLTLESTDGYRVDLVLPETYIERVRLGQTVLAAIPAINKANLAVTVSTIVPAADPASRSFLLKATLPADLPVKSGMFARVRVPLGQRDKLLIPLSAVVRHGQLTGLFLVDSEGIAHFRLLRLGDIFQESVEVLAGLKEGDRYVVEPPPNLLDGARVEAVS